MRNCVKEHYDRCIISEDDNEFSPNFLEYINKGRAHEVKTFLAEKTGFNVRAYNVKVIPEIQKKALGKIDYFKLK